MIAVGSLPISSIPVQKNIVGNELGNGNIANPQTQNDFGSFFNSFMNLNKQQNNAQYEMSQVLNGNMDYAPQALIDSEMANFNLSFATKVRDTTVQTINQLMNMQM